MLYNAGNQGEAECLAPARPQRLRLESGDGVRTLPLSLFYPSPQPFNTHRNNGKWATCLWAVRPYSLVDCVPVPAPSCLLLFFLPSPRYSRRTTAILAI